MDKVKPKTSGGYVSPYLRRPLRSLADAMADRQATTALAARVREAYARTGEGRRAASSDSGRR